MTTYISASAPFTFGPLAISFANGIPVVTLGGHSVDVDKGSGRYDAVVPGSQTIVGSLWLHDSPDGDVVLVYRDAEQSRDGLVWQVTSVFPARNGAAGRSSFAVDGPKLVDPMDDYRDFAKGALCMCLCLLMIAIFGSMINGY